MQLLSLFFGVRGGVSLNTPQPERGDSPYYSSLAATAFCCASCGETLCRTNRPEKVREIPTHHSVICGSPKISWPRKACSGTK